MRRISYLLIAIILVSGCKTTFKSGFKDFNAYYNTYYNAKLSYNQGLKKNLAQDRTYNTLQPIRIYETPKGAGASEFNNAIEKGASVLRKYKETKWVDDALEIIGKSYFYRNEYFNAMQKFEELYVSSADAELKQRSIFWKGRVLLELQAYSEGIQFLNEQLSLLEGEWRGSLQFQVQTVLSEHYIATENWVNAHDLLSESVSKIPERANKERGYFLLGQLNEILGETEAAFNAYDRVEKYYTNYDLQFAARKKKAEVARDLGDTDEAFKVFSSMVKDDKNTEFVSELNFELGKTEQDRGRYEEARDIYISVLRDPLNKPDNKTKALTYNGLAELNRFIFDDFTLAAAYYDSSSRINIPADQLPESYNAKDLAQSFGEYASLKFQIFEQDSLLWLGSLSEEELDSVIADLEAKKIAELERLREEEEERRNTIINVGNSSNQNQNQQNESNGFLNIKNPVLLADASAQFGALWGGRPLVDNWRVSELIINAVVEDTSQVSSGDFALSNNNAAVGVTIDLSRIPFTPSDQDSVREIVSIMNYELANLFFLSLELPDSAAFYFSKVLDERPESEVAAVAMYSLSELYDIKGETELASSLAQELVSKFPNTIYAERVVDKYNFILPETYQETEINPLDTYLAISSNQDLSVQMKSEQLIELALQYPREDFSDRAFFESIESYIKLGMQEQGFEDSLRIWQDSNLANKELKESFEYSQDSVRIILADSSINISTADSIRYNTLLDSTFIPTDINHLFPYNGTYWDSTRSKIELFSNTYNSSEYSNIISRWRNEFKEPVIEVIEELPAEDVVTVIEEESTESKYLNCEDLDGIPTIRGGLDVFNQVVNIPDGNTDASILFRFLINPRGIVEDYELLSETDNDRLVSAYESAIESFISFEPILFEGQAQFVSCDIEFFIPE